jgi:hypothetical protein
MIGHNILVDGANACVLEKCHFYSLLHLHCVVTISSSFRRYMICETLFRFSFMRNVKEVSWEE